MADYGRLRLLLPEYFRHFPADLSVVVWITASTVATVLIPEVGWRLLRVALGLPFVLFFPGYALIAALFPESHDIESGDGDGITSRYVAGSVDRVERLLLSFGVSMAVSPLVLLVLNFTPWGIRVTPYVLSTGAIIVGASVVAAYRRMKFPPEDRYSLRVRQRAARMQREFLKPDRSGQVLNVLLVVCIIGLLGSVAYAATMPGHDERFTEFYLLSQDGEGQLIADGYPTEYTRGEGRPIVVAIENRERATVNYTVVVELQRVGGPNSSTPVRESHELHRFETTLAHEERRLHRHEVAPTMTGNRLRLTYLLYRGQPPGNPMTENAYREVHLWINASAP